MRLGQLKTQDKNIKVRKEEGFDFVGTPLHSLVISKIEIIKRQDDNAVNINVLVSQWQELEKLHRQLVESLPDNYYKNGEIMIWNIYPFYKEISNLDTLKQEEEKELQGLWRVVQRLEKKNKYQMIVKVY